MVFVVKWYWLLTIVAILGIGLFARAVWRDMQRKLERATLLRAAFPQIRPDILHYLMQRPRLEAADMAEAFLDIVIAMKKTGVDMRETLFKILPERFGPIPGEFQYFVEDMDEADLASFALIMKKTS